MGDSSYKISAHDNLSKIVKAKYNLTTNHDVMNMVQNVAKYNNLKNINCLKVGQEIKLPENFLNLSKVTIFNPDKKSTDNLTSAQPNYYRANDVFGDIATKKNEYPNQEPVPSQITQKTEHEDDTTREDVTAYIRGFFVNTNNNAKKTNAKNSFATTARDAKMCDIFAKEVGTWKNSKGETKSGGFAFEQTDAYNFALEVNNGDYQTLETEYKDKEGNVKQELHAFYNPSTSDGKITLFSTEKINGQEYLTMRDKSGNLHYFDKTNNLSEVKLSEK